MAAVSTCCSSGLVPVVASSESDRLGVSYSRVAHSGAPISEGPLPTPQQDSKASTQSPAEPSRWVSRTVLSATAAAVLSLTSSTPAVHALEDGLSAYNTPGNIGINIAIPIPDNDQWVFSEYGFIAPLPGKGLEVVRVMGFDGGCPAWQSTEFERVVPDHGHPKPFPRRGNQWPASLSAEEAAPLLVLSHGGEDFTRYPDLEVVLEEISSLGGLTCFSL